MTSREAAKLAPKSLELYILHEFVQWSIIEVCLHPVHVYVCVCVHAFVYVCVDVCVCVRAQVHVCMYVCASVRVPIIVLHRPAQE